MRRVLIILTILATFSASSAWIMPGDVDGDFQWTDDDVAWITLVVLGVIDRPQLPVPAAADPTRDGSVSMYDAAWVLARITK